MNTQQQVNLEIENPATALELVFLIQMHWRKRKPVMLWGDSGIGKSQLSHQLAALINARLIDFRTNIREPVDMRGVPVPNLETRTTDWFAPSELPKSDGSDGPTVLLIDEINTGTMQMMSVMMQLILDRRVGDYVLPDNCVIIACGNRSKDSRAVVQMPKPLRNRFAHYTMIVDHKSWYARANAAGLAPEIVAFIHFREECLMQQQKGDANAYATPRSIWDCGDYVNEPSHLRLKAFTALVGKDVATEMEAFVSMYQHYQALPDILANPKTAPVPTQPDVKYAIAVALSRIAERKNFANVITYAERLPDDIGTFCVLDAVARDESLANTSAYGKWAVAHKHVLL